MDEAGSWDNLHERFEVKRINHNLYFLSRGIPPLTREQAELFHAQAPGWLLPEEAHHIGRSFPVSQSPRGA
jgi:hypothetical protein